MAANSIVWQQTADRRTWRAARGSVALTVTRLTSGAYQADIDSMAVRAPEFRTRLAAQAWAEERSRTA